MPPGADRLVAEPAQTAHDGVPLIDNRLGGAQKFGIDLGAPHQFLLLVRGQDTGDAPPADGKLYRGAVGSQVLCRWGGIDRSFRQFQSQGLGHGAHTPFKNEDPGGTGHAPAPSGSGWK